MSFDTERFIIEIQNRPCLWDSALKEYSDRNLKIKCWDEIVMIFKEKDEMTNGEKKQLADALQKKWKSIRGCFTRELNRQKTLKSGSGCRSRKSEYLFFKQLLFLQKVAAIREPESVAAASDPVDDSQLDRQVINLPKKMKTKEKPVSEDDKFIEALNRSIESREKCETSNQDEDRLFMLSLVNTLKKVPPQRKMATKIKIMSILDDATRTVPNIENNEVYNQNFWSPQPEPPSRNYHPGYSTRRGGPEIPSTMDYNIESLTSAPPSNVTNISEESSILDIYD